MATSMGNPASSVGPITSGERILYIDVLRGMALFGILAANMRGFSAPEDLYGNIGALFHGRADTIAQGFVDIFLQGKFITLFSFLFGLGFAVQLSRATARGAKFMSFYPRRLAALAMFGVIHGLLIWWGDILLTYAVAGTLLLFFRNRQSKTLLWWAGGIFVLPILVNIGFYITWLIRHPHWMVSASAGPDMTKVHKLIDIYAHGTAAQMLHQNWVTWKGILPSTGFAIYALFLFLLGMWVWRSGIVEHLEQYKSLLKRVFVICLPLGIVLNTIVVLLSHSPRVGHPTLPGLVSQALDLPSAHVLSAAYASGLALLFIRNKWRPLLASFAAIGRMALTNYLMESILCTLFYYNYTTGTYGRVGPAMGLIPTVVLYGAQVVFSNWWLKRFRFGPMEWLWRGLTYGKLPDLRHEPAIAAPLPMANEAAASE